MIKIWSDCPAIPRLNWCVGHTLLFCLFSLGARRPLPLNQGKVIAFVLPPINRRPVFRLTNFHLFLSKKQGGVNTGGSAKFPPGSLLDSAGRSRLLSGQTMVAAIGRVAPYGPRLREPLRLNHHGLLGPSPIMKFFVGAVREPPLRMDFHGKDTGAHREATVPPCLTGYRLSWCCGPPGGPTGPGRGSGCW